MHVHVIRGRNANSYLVEEGDRLMAVDVSYLSDGAVFEYLTDELQRPPEALELVTCTHGHADHLGGVMQLATRCGAGVLLPPLTSSWRNSLMPSPARILSHLRGKAPEVGRLAHGEAVPGFSGWRVIHTPGHTEDSCCFYHPASRSLISGDTVLGSGRTGKLVLPVVYRDRAQLVRTVDTLAALEPHAVYPGHGTSLTGSDLLAELAGALAAS